MYLINIINQCHVPSEFKVDSVHPDYRNAEPQFAFFLKHAVCQFDHRIAGIKV